MLVERATGDWFFLAEAGYYLQEPEKLRKIVSDAGASPSITERFMLRTTPVLGCRVCAKGDSPRVLLTESGLPMFT